MFLELKTKGLKPLWLVLNLDLILFFFLFIIIIIIFKALFQ